MAEKEGWKFVGFRVDPELRKRLNVALAQNEESAQDVLARLVKEYVEQTEARSSGKTLAAASTKPAPKKVTLGSYNPDEE